MHIYKGTATVKGFNAHYSIFASDTQEAVTIAATLSWDSLELFWWALKWTVLEALSRARWCCPSVSWIVQLTSNYHANKRGSLGVISQYGKEWQCFVDRGFVHRPTRLCQVLWGVYMQLTFPRLCLKIYQLLLSFLWEQSKLNWSWRNYPSKEQKRASSSARRSFLFLPPRMTQSPSANTCLEITQLNTSLFSQGN